MTDITFYHLTETALDEALPVLVVKSRERQWNVTIQTVSEDVRDRLDALLWSFQADSFLPHGRDGDAPESAHPVFLTTTGANPNRSAIRFLVDGASVPENPGDYQRLALMFDGRDESAVSKARNDWKTLKEAGHALTYWKQTPEGRWEKAA